MSEDLDSFFAKRKTKASKKKGAIKIDEVAQSLEHSLKFGPDETDLLGSRPKDSDHSHKHEEDAEWIGFDAKSSAAGETAGVFNYSEQVEQEYVAEERKQQAEKVKTWQKPVDPEPVKEETPPVQTPAPVVEPPKSQSSSAYVPPAARSGYQPPSKRAPVHKVDIGNEELFPSLGDTFTVKEEKPKQKSHEVPQESIPQDPVQQDGRRNVPEHLRAPTSQPQQWRTEESQSEHLRQPASQPWRSEESQPEERSTPQQWRKEEPQPEQRPTPQQWRKEESESEQKPIPEQRPVVEQKPRVSPFGNQEPRPIPAAPAPRADGRRGTGMLNARGEEITIADRPLNPEPQQPTQNLTWRRAAGNTVQDVRPVQTDSPPAEQQRHLPPPDKPEVRNWRTDNKPVSAAAPQQQNSRFEQRRQHDRPPRDQHDRRDFNRAPREHRPERDSQRSVESRSETQRWRREEPVADESNPPNPPVQESQPVSVETEGDDWHTVAGSKSKSNRRATPGSPTKYVPPSRR